MSYDDWKPLYVKLTKAYSKPENAEQCAAYFEALRDLSADAMGRGVVKTIGDVRFFPKAAELRERAAAVARSVTPALQQCYRCGGSTWVPGPPKHEFGLVYETVERCPDCWPFPRKQPSEAA